MTTRTIIGIVLFGLGTTGVILANMFVMMMIGEINRKRKEGELVSYFGFTFQKFLRVMREYRNWYPDGRLRAYCLIAIGASAIAAVGMAICFRII